MTLERGERWLKLGISLLFLPLGVLFFIGGWATRWRDTSIESDGTRAIATITSRKIVHSDGASYELRYTFQRADDVQVQSRRYVSKRFWSARHVGDTMTVAFADDRPNLSFPPGQGSTSAGLAVFASAVGTVFMLIGFVVARSAFHGAAPADDFASVGAADRAQPTRNSSSARR